MAHGILCIYSNNHIVVQPRLRLLSNFVLRTGLLAENRHKCLKVWTFVAYFHQGWQKSLLDRLREVVLSF